MGEGMNIQLIMFYLFSFCAIMAAVGVVSFKEAIHCGTSLLVTIFCIAVLFLLLQAEFIAAVQIYIYAGAIMVLVIVVVLLINVRISGENRHVPLIAASAVTGAALFLMFLYVIASSTFAPPQGIYTPEYQVANGGQTMQIGLMLFREYLFPFEIASVLLLVGMIGAIVLPTRRRFRRKGQGGDMI